jgi:hypothetical protein
VKCSGVAFSKLDANGKYNLVGYAFPVGGLDSTKREFVRNLHFVNANDDKAKKEFHRVWVLKPNL